MIGENLYLGHYEDYWLELQRQVIKEKDANLIDEIATLRSKVSFYESRIEQLSDFMIKNMHLGK